LKPDAVKSIDAIKQAAAERGRANGVAYAGLLTPGEAYALMQAGARLVDVRTRAELDWVGRVPGAAAVEWNNYPEGQRNPEFLAQLGRVAKTEEPVMFLCRSGARSHHAATLATRAGYAECYNVLEGFEGDKDGSQQRGKLGGWRHAGLPWVQS
jgi:rhodanese-related sulfurtransferase